MFTSENVLSAELINENSIKVTHKEGDDVLITTIQKNPRKEAYKSLISSGWTLKKIKEKTKELQSIEDPSARLVEKIAGGYSWALDQLKDKRNQINDLVAEIESLNNDIKNLEKDRLNAAQEVQTMWEQHKNATQEVKTMWEQHKEAWTNQNKAVLELVSIYDEHEKAVSELRKIYDEQDQVSNNLTEISNSYEKNLLNYKNDVQQMKVKFQQNYDKYQELYGLNVTDFLFETADIDKEMLFKVKLECLSREELKKKDKSFKSKVRKAKTMHELIKLVVNELEA